MAGPEGWTEVPELTLDCMCKNCQHMHKMQSLALKAVSTAVNEHRAVDEHVVFMWNETVRLFPCLEPKGGER